MYFLEYAPRVLTSKFAIRGSGYSRITKGKNTLNKKRKSENDKKLIFMSLNLKEKRVIKNNDKLCCYSWGKMIHKTFSECNKTLALKIQNMNCKEPKSTSKKKLLTFKTTPLLN